MLVDALHPALEDAEIAFDRVRRHVAAHVFLKAVVHGIMRGEVLAEVVVLQCLVGVDHGIRCDVRLEDRQGSGC